MYNTTRLLLLKKQILLGLFIISLILRLSFTYIEYSANDTTFWVDAKLYLEAGRSFAEGNFNPSYEEFKNIIVGPVVPALVALSQIVFGDPIRPVLIFNCLITSLLVYILFWLGNNIVGLKTGYILAIWSVFNFNIIRFNYQILKEPLLFVLIPGIIVCLVKVYQKRKVFKNILLSSLLFSVLIHTDERFFVYVPFIILFILLYSGRKKIKYSIIWLMILIVTMFPWGIKNYKQYGQIVILTPRTTAITSKLWGSDLIGLYFIPNENLEGYIQAQEEEALITGSKYGVTPRKYGRNEKYLKAFVHYWQPTYFRFTYTQYGLSGNIWSLSHNLNSILFYGIFLPFYVAGFIYSGFKRKWQVFYLAFLPFLHGLLHTAIVLPLERYRLPMDFLVVLVSLWFVSEIKQNLYKLGKQ